MNLQDLRLDTRFLTNASEDDYTKADLERNLNNRYDETVTFIWRNQSGWKFDDSNYGTLPEATADLTAGRADYTLPTSARAIDQVHIKNKSGEFVRLKRLQENKTPAGSVDAGFPREFGLVGRSIVLRPAPSDSEVTILAGIKILVSREVIPLTEDLDIPGFDREFHRLLSIGAALDWCIASEIPRKARELENQWEKLLDKLKEFYANRDNTISYRLQPQRQDYAS